MNSTPITEDFADIKARLAELERDKKPAEAPKAWPDYSEAERVYGMYAAPTLDEAYSGFIAGVDGFKHAEYELQQRLRSQSYSAPDSDPA